MNDPVEITEFQKKYPILYAHFLFLTEKEFHRANISAIKKTAKACDYEASIRLVYLDPKAIWLDFIRDKRCRLADAIRSNKKTTAQHATYRRQFYKAEVGVNPFPGRKDKVIASRPLLTEEFIRTVIEIQELKKTINCKYTYTIHIFNRNNRFWKAVQDVKLKVFKKQNPAWFTRRLFSIIDEIERKLINDICNRDPFQIAKQILAEENAVSVKTIERKILFGVIPELKRKYPDISATPDDIMKFVDYGRRMSQSRQKRRRGGIP